MTAPDRPASDTDDPHRVRVRVRVLQSFGAPRTTSNPYLSQLLRSLDDVADVHTFGWRAAFAGRYDVFHVHWPERLVRGRSAATTVVRSVLFVALLVVIRWRRQAVVRTAHNVAPHERRTRLEAFVLARCDRATTLWIRLNPETPTPDRAPGVTILHGHYRDWLGSDAPADAPGRPRRLLTFGQLRRYKGIDALLDAFALVDDDAATLRIVGRPLDPELAATVDAAARADARITAHLDFVPEEELVRAVLDAQLVVLPYRDLNNSGAALFALSLDRPVLVPDNTVTRALAEEVGADWVLTYPAPLTPRLLTGALDRTHPSTGARPDLGLREWRDAGPAHARAYESAVRLSGRWTP